jgi:predicted nucleotidyltransferase component of viral defense system
MSLLDSLVPKNHAEAEHLLRELMHDIALAGLYRAGFFKHAAFYGGTALRIFHGLDRFSEDLDFSLLAKNDQFSLEPFLNEVVAEFAAHGMQVQVKHKPKKSDAQIDSAFLKTGTLWHEFVLDSAIPSQWPNPLPKVKIKFEVDTLPPLDFETEHKLLLRPYSFYVNCMTIPNLYAGKVHAVLFRSWKTRVKGRDWYDLEWYIRHSFKLNLAHLNVRIQEGVNDSNGYATSAELVAGLHERIDRVDFNAAKHDVARFVPRPELLDIWSSGYFHDLVDHIQVV